MKLEDIIYDVKTILDALQVSTRVKDRYLIYKIGNYRALFLEQQFVAGMDINPAYYQRLPNQVSTIVNSSDLGIGDTVSSIKFTKYTLPGIIKLGDIRKSVKVRSTSKQVQFYYKELPFIMELIFARSFLLKQFHYWFLEGPDLYIYKPADADILILLEDPTDGFNIDTHNYTVSQISSGKSYTVISGSVLEDTGSSQYIYKVDDEFTVNSTYTYTGDGIMVLTDQINSIKENGEYPLDRAMAQRISLAILTNEYKIELGTITDIVNDAEDQFRILKSGDN